MSVLLEVTELTKHFPIGTGLFGGNKGIVQAVNGVSFTVDAGETVALVGESGCGKTTTGKAIMGFYRPTSGSVRFDGQELSDLPKSQLRGVRRDMQYVFQDPYASLPPRLPVGQILAEPLKIHGLGSARSQQVRVRELLEMVGLRPEMAARYPHEFSGGQRQRVGIARALALEPRLLILDEPVSALDVSVQAQVINLLGRLQEQLHLAYVFIAHDLGVVRHIAHRVAVMYLGHVVEYGEGAQVFERPTHPYTQALLSAVPVPDPRLRDADRRRKLHGELPSATNVPSGCPFRTRCWLATDRCAEEQPELRIRLGGAAKVACHYAGEAAETSAEVLPAKA